MFNEIDKFMGKGYFAKSGKNETDFKHDKISKGVQVEMEHTDKLLIALRIALDHLSEYEDYYEGLEILENILEANNGRLSKGRDIGIMCIDKNIKFALMKELKEREDFILDITKNRMHLVNISDRDRRLNNIYKIMKLIDNIPLCGV